MPRKKKPPKPYVWKGPMAWYKGWYMRKVYTGTWRAEFGDGHFTKTVAPTLAGYCYVAGLIGGGEDRHQIPRPKPPIDIAHGLDVMFHLLRLRDRKEFAK